MALGLTQQQMADLLFLSDSAISYLETPPHKCPHLQTIMLIRYHLAKPEFARKLKSAGYPHPYPEDLDSGSAEDVR
jgi:predicted transcriptional regulator